MSCNCDVRARKLLSLLNYELRDGWWIKEGASPIPDIELNKSHFYLSLKALKDSMSKETVLELYTKLFEQEKLR